MAYKSKYKGIQIDDAVGKVIEGTLQDKLTAGDGIKIEENVISADVDHSVYATKEEVAQAIDEIPIEKGEGTNSIKTKGINHIVSGIGGVAFGGSTPNTASGISSFAEGIQTQAKGDASHAEGLLTETTNRAEHAQGMFNVSHPNTIHSIGFGAASMRQNAEETYMDGRKFLYRIGGYDGTNPDDSKSVQEVINGKQEKLTEGTGISISNNIISCTLDTTIFTVVTSLPSLPVIGDEKKIHLVLSSISEKSNTYDEYLWVNNSWEKIGSFRPTIDLTEYAKISYVNNSIKEVNDKLNTKLETPISIDYLSLKSLRNSSKLVHGQQYRITNYYAKINPEIADISSQANGTLYDIIVTATSTNTLSEEAKATHHINADGTIVLENSKIESWKVWYCLDNDTSRFSWAYKGDYYTSEGLGVVYRLIDEFGNDCPYDFKEILFKRYKIIECVDCPTLVGKYTSKEDSKYVIDKTQSIWAYTFTYLTEEGKVLDYSLVGATMPNNEGKYTGVYNNKILPISSYLGIYSEDAGQFQYCLNNIVFISDGVISKGLSYGCYSNVFGSNCHSMTFGTSCHSNTFGENCYENVFGNSIKYQSLGKNCHNNIFGDGHNHNSIGNACSNNIFGSNYVYNTIGYNCYNNILGDNYSHNSLGNSNYALKLGNNLQSNTFLNYCSNIIFGSDSSASEKYAFYKNNFFGNNNKYILFGQIEASTYQYIQNYIFSNGLQGKSSSYLTISGERNRSFETKVAKNSEGELKIYCEADLIY